MTLPRARGGALPVLWALVGVLLSSCAGQSYEGRGGSARQSAAPATPAVRYVALGDSYTAAPYVYLTGLAHGCLRSDHNYPSLLARHLHARTFTDVSCSGAATRHVWHRQRTFRGMSVPAQLRAVTPRTTLVTVGLGGNDEGIFSDMVIGCPLQVVPGRGGSATTGRCSPVDPARLRSAVARVGPRLARVVRAVRHRAPHARIVVVGYPRVVAPGTSCPSRLPLAPGADAMVDELARLLNRTQARAARRGRAQFLDLYRLSAGHDVCAPTPWVNGVRTDPDRAAALHPFGVEQRAVAQALARRLGR